MHDLGAGLQSAATWGIVVVIAVRQAGAEEYEIAGPEFPDVVAREAQPPARFDMGQLAFRMKVKRTVEGAGDIFTAEE